MFKLLYLALHNIINRWTMPMNAEPYRFLSDGEVPRITCLELDIRVKV